MVFRLPPLSSLRVFECAARQGSFRKAADELSLTASAVSHGIQTLENWLGVELFYRESRGLRLTEAGEAYAPVVTQALSVLAKATEQLPGRKATGTLSISSAPSFASRILLPRLENFIAQHPGIEVTIDSSHRLVDLTLDDFDLAIRYTSTQKPAPNWTLLLAETMVPVCSPDLKQRLGLHSDTDLQSRAPLIHLTSTSADWSEWFRATGVDIQSPIHTGFRFDTMRMAFDAAIRGLGVVLGRFPLVNEEIESGQLVTLGSEPIPSGNGYWLVTAQTEFQKPEVKLFRQWLLAEFGIGTEHHRPVRSVAR
jgi:LysR family transcriptional regulator, glycine cleavage system transcriptional activator